MFLVWSSACDSHDPKKNLVLEVDSEMGNWLVFGTRSYSRKVMSLFCAAGVINQGVLKLCRN